MNTCTAISAIVALASVSSAQIISIAGGNVLDNSDPANADFPLPDTIEAGVPQGIDEGIFTVGVDLSLAAIQSALGPVSIDPGTEVRSHLIGLDPVPFLSVTDVLVRFELPVLGVITSDAGLASTHSVFGLSTLNYPGSTFQYGLEPGDGAVKVLPRAISFTASAGSPGDYVRVITAVPAPGGALAVAGVGLIAARRRR